MIHCSCLRRSVAHCLALRFAMTAAELEEMEATGGGCNCAKCHPVAVDPQRAQKAA